MKRRKTNRPHGMTAKELAEVRAFEKRKQEDPYVSGGKPTFVHPPCRCAQQPFPHYHPGQACFEEVDAIHYVDGDAMASALKELIVARQPERSDWTMRWFVSTNEEALAQPEWLRSAAVDDNNVVFLPAALTGNEDRTFLEARRQVVAYIGSGGHTYLPATYLADHYPEIRADVLILARRVRKAAEGRDRTGEEGRNK